MASQVTGMNVTQSKIDLIIFDRKSTVVFNLYKYYASISGTLNLLIGIRDILVSET
jgi:hypothetical protein